MMLMMMMMMLEYRMCIKMICFRLLDWRPEKMRGERSKHERYVIIKNLFEPEMIEKEVELLLEYQGTLREECGKCGTVRKVVVFDVSSDVFVKTCVFGSLTICFVYV